MLQYNPQFHHQLLNLKMLDNKLRVNYSYWNVDAHRKNLKTNFLYWDAGQNEIFRDTERLAFEFNHTVNEKSFYTIRVSDLLHSLGVTSSK